MWERSKISIQDKIVWSNLDNEVIDKKAIHYNKNQDQ